MTAQLRQIEAWALVFGYAGGGSVKYTWDSAAHG